MAIFRKAIREMVDMKAKDGFHMVKEKLKLSMENSTQKYEVVFRMMILMENTK